MKLFQNFVKLDHIKTFSAVFAQCWNLSFHKMVTLHETAVTMRLYTSGDYIFWFSRLAVLYVEYSLDGPSGQLVSPISYSRSLLSDNFLIRIRLTAQRTALYKDQAIDQFKSRRLFRIWFVVLNRPQRCWRRSWLGASSWGCWPRTSRWCWWAGSGRPRSLRPPCRRDDRRCGRPVRVKVEG